MLSILDVGCGVAQRGDVNVDLRRPAACIKNKFIIGDVHHLPFRENTFDKIICYHLIEHVKDPFLLLDELIRITNGIVEITCPHRFMVYAKSTSHRHCFSRGWFKDFARHKGLGVKAIVRIDAERDLFKYILPLEIFVWLWKVDSVDR